MSIHAIKDRKIPSIKSNFDATIGLEIDFITSDLALVTIKTRSTETSSIAPFSNFALLMPTTIKLDTPLSPGTEISSSSTLSSLEGFSPLRLTKHGQEVDQQAVENGTYIKFSQKELDKRELTVNDNGLLMLNGKPLTTIGDINYVMLPNGKFYADYPKRGSYYHSSTLLR